MSDTRLQHALSRLPQYSPPPGVWAEIEAALAAEQFLEGAVQSLPEHAPPTAVWAGIEAGLEKAQQPRPIRRVLFPRRVQLAAASLLLFLAAGWWLLRPTPIAPTEVAERSPETPKQEIPASIPVPRTPAVQRNLPHPPPPNKATTRDAITFSQQVVDNQLLEVCREPENDAFSLVDQLCRTQMPVCEIPAFKSLKTELDELTTAQNELRQALGQYADDPQLLAQMVQLERERTAILQQLVQFI